MKNCSSSSAACPRPTGLWSASTDSSTIGQFYTSNGISSEVAYVYLATAVELAGTHREPTELRETRLLPVAEALRMAREGKITNGPSALALLWCESLLQTCVGQRPA